jgi:creatinine amidohydrolase
MPGVFWATLRRDEIGAAAQHGAVTLLPLGAIEQHGPHLPVNTDINAALRVCTRAAESMPERALVLPPVWWGLSPYWMSFPGTLTLRPETLLNLITDIASSVRHHGFTRLIIVNGHGGNDGLIQAAAAHASSPEFRVASVSYWNLAPDVLRATADRGIGHAGEAETSIALYLQPDLVDQAALDAGVDLPIARRSTVAAPHGVYEPPWPEHDSPQGVMGHPPAGNVETGRRIVDTAAANLARLIQELAAA